MKTIREQLLEEIADFRARHNMSQTRFGEIALNARGFVGRLERGVHSPTLDTVEKLRAFMRDYKPPTENPKRAAEQVAA